MNLQGSRIPFWTVDVGEDEKRLLNEAISRKYINEGVLVRELEEALAERLQVEHVVCTTSGTAALYLSLAAHHIGPGDEVIVPDITFAATANAVTMTGASVKLVDVCEQDLTIDLEKIEQAIGPETKALMPVHISGRSVDMKAIMQLAKKYNLRVIEDAAECIGSVFESKQLGAWGDCGVLSFAANKTLTTGQGGAVLTNDAEVAERIRMIKNQGRRGQGTGGADIHFMAGFNLRMTDLQAAVGLGQLPRLDERLKRLQQNQSLYHEALRGLKQVRLLPFREGEVAQWTDLLVEDREGLMKYLSANNIETRAFWHPLHQHAAYKADKSLFPVSEKVCETALWLPSSFELTDEQVHHVAGHIKRFYGVAS